MTKYFTHEVVVAADCSAFGTTVSPIQKQIQTLIVVRMLIGHPLRSMDCALRPLDCSVTQLTVPNYSQCARASIWEVTGAAILNP